MIGKRVQLILMALLLLFLLGACSKIEDLTQNADVSQIEEAEFYNALQDTVAQVQIPVIFVGLINLLAGWKLGRAGLAINGFVIGGLMIYTYLHTNDLVQDENTLRALAAGGGVLTGILAFFLYNLMSLIIGGAIGTTLMGGAWLQVAEKVPPQILVFVTTFISAMVMFLVFRLFMVAFSAIIGAALLMLAVPYETLWVIPVAAVGTLIQTGIAWWISDDIFGNLRGDFRAAVGEAFGEVLGPFGVLREHQREALPAHEVQSGASKQAPQASPQHYSSQQSPSISHQSSVPPQQAYSPPPVQPYNPPAQQAYSPPPAQPYNPPAQQAYSPPPAQPYNPPAQQAYSPPPVQPYNPPVEQYTPPSEPVYSPSAQTQYHPPQQNDMAATQQNLKFKPENLQIALSDGRTFPLVGFQVTVGRSPDNVIVVNDPQVSGHHLILSIQPEGVVVWDNNSTNGTYLNGSLLKGSHRLTMDDVLRIGAVTLRMVRRHDPEITQAP